MEKLLKQSLTLKCSGARPIRQLIARCYLIIYRVGDGRTLYDTCNGMLTILMNAVAKGNILGVDFSKVYVN